MESLFGAKRIPLNTLEDLEKSAPDIIVYAAPIMFFFVLLEFVVSTYQNRKYYQRNESIGSILVGLGNVGVGLIIKTFLFYMLVVIYNLVPWRMEFQWWTFIPCYILFDLCSYWAHRVSHHTRFFWAAHVPHHSGENYNLTVSFRLSWMQYVKIMFFFPVFMLGFHPVILFITNQIAVLFQFWVHTEYIRKLHPAIEYVFATPSNHRVHHGSQSQYINKNFGATFIFWDRMFGTYQPEEHTVTYGLTHNIDHKHDPIHINFHEYIAIMRDAVKAPTWKEKLFYIFGDPELVANYKEAKRQQQVVHDKKTLTPQPQAEPVHTEA